MIAVIAGCNGILMICNQVVEISLWYCCHQEYNQQEEGYESSYGWVLLQNTEAKICNVNWEYGKRSVLQVTNILTSGQQGLSKTLLNNAEFFHNGDIEPGVILGSS
jgi:hypothetical protein